MTSSSEYSSNNKTNNFDPPHVFFARGHGVEKNTGNKIYRHLIHSNHEAYKTAHDRKSQTSIARDVISSIECNGGRFLCKVKTSDEDAAAAAAAATAEWTQVSSRSLMRKVKQSLRDCKPSPPSNNGNKTSRNVYQGQKCGQLATATATTTTTIKQYSCQDQIKDHMIHKMPPIDHYSCSNHLQLHDTQPRSYEHGYNQGSNDWGIRQDQEQTDDEDSIALLQDILMDGDDDDDDEEDDGDVNNNNDENVERNHNLNQSIDMEEIKTICDNAMAMTMTTATATATQPSSMNPLDEKLKASEFVGMSSIETFHVSSDFAMSRTFRGTGLFLESKDPHRMMDIFENVRIHQL